MAKSGDNFVTLSVLEKKGYSAFDYRYFCLGTHYRNPLMFSYEAMDSAKTARKKLNDKILELKSNGGKVSSSYLEKFTKGINDDLNTSKGMAVMWELVKDDSLSDNDKYATLLKFDSVLGFGLKNFKVEKIPAEVKNLAEKRLVARNNKDWKKSDELRDKIKEFGYVIGDTKEGFKIDKV